MLHHDAEKRAENKHKQTMCMSMAQADRLVAAAEASDRPFKVFENFLFHPSVMKAREPIDDDAIAPPVDPHQEQSGTKRHRMEGFRERRGMAAAAGAIRRRAAGVRRRTPQVRAQPRPFTRETTSGNMARP